MSQAFAQQTSGISQIVAQTLSRSPYQLVLAAIVLLCVITRLTSGSTEDTTSPAKRVRLLPYWIPYVGHAFSFGTRLNGFVNNIRDTSKDGVTGIWMGGAQHNLVISPSLARGIMKLRNSVLSTDALQLYILKQFFGDGGAMGTMNHDDWAHDIARILHSLMLEPFLTTAVNGTRCQIMENEPNLVTFSRSVVDQMRWERHANVVLVDTTTPAVEADLPPLLRDFVGNIATQVLMGSSFMTNFPNALADLSAMDANMRSFLLGVPTWFPNMTAAAAARRNLQTAVQEFHQALDAVDDGRDPGHRWNDMSDVSNVMKERRRAWRKCHAPVKASRSGDLAILWAMNVNANQIVFWLLYHILAEPGLQADIMKEIKPHTKLTQERTGLPIEPSPHVSLDLNGLRNCQLLKACFYETMRVDSTSMSYKKVISDFEITESAEDAKLNGKAQPQTYLIPKGQHVVTMHGAHQSDPRFYPNPSKFDPARFLVPDKDDPSKLVADMKTAAPFGAGHSVCKGRKFAQDEVMLFVAALLTGWNFEPVDKAGWVHPGHAPASSAFNANRNLRVRVTRKKVEGAA